MEACALNKLSCYYKTMYPQKSEVEDVMIKFCES